MRQFSVRLSDEHGAAIKRLADQRGRSVNQTFEDLVVAATDPATAGSEVEALRERLSRAGIVVRTSTYGHGRRPSAERLARARAAASTGTPLSDIVTEQRG